MEQEEEPPPIYDLKVEDEIGDDQEEGITLERMLISKTMSNKFFAWKYGYYNKNLASF